MAQNSPIEWTDSTWNPLLGCTRISAGCQNCYAESMSRRLGAMARRDLSLGKDPGRKAGYLNVIDAKGRWNNQVHLCPEALDDPLKWKRHRMVFVNSMSDLFHKEVPMEFIQKVFNTMNSCPQHAFQVLTKRPERVAQVRDDLNWSQNIWIGTSVEDARVMARVRAIQQVHGAAVRFLSLEPLLGPLPNLALKRIDWVIVGGESGPKSRPMMPDWVRQIRDQCEDQQVPFFFKQWGGVNKKKAGRTLDGRTWDEMPEV